MKLFVLTIVLSLVGCTTAKVVTGPDGSAHQLISCDSIEGCYEMASKLCGKYKIVNNSTHTGGANGYTSTQTNLLVKCE